MKPPRQNDEERNGPVAATATGSDKHGEIDLAKLAEKVYELLKGELRVERERNGDSSPWDM